YSLFFFSSRRRHTRLQGDWIQTCALPILERRSKKPEGNNVLLNARLLQFSVEVRQFPSVAWCAESGERRSSGTTRTRSTYPERGGACGIFSGLSLEFLP